MEATKDLEPIKYSGVLLNTLLHATIYVYTQFAECTAKKLKLHGLSLRANYTDRATAACR
jgi:hypothetical protein